jgi:hypothetical protein
MILFSIFSILTIKISKRFKIFSEGLVSTSLGFFLGITVAAALFLLFVYTVCGGFRK